MKKYRGRKRKVFAAFDNEAVDSDKASESDESNQSETEPSIQEKEMTPKEVLEAQRRVADRHERNRIFQRTNSQELADAYESRVQNMSTLGHHAVHKTAGSRRPPNSPSQHNLSSSTHIEGRIERPIDINRVGLGLPTELEIEQRSIQNNTFYARRDYDTGPNGDRIRKENGACRVSSISKDSTFFRGEIIYSIGDTLIDSLTNRQIDELLLQKYDKNKPTYPITVTQCSSCSCSCCVT